ncbi:MAG: hypothetical protein V2A76_00385 [Planctomycetota bacterium]
MNLLLLLPFLLLFPDARQEKVLVVQLTPRPHEVVVGDETVLVDRLTETLAGLEASDVILLVEGDGGTLPARAALQVVDRLLRSGRPVRVVLPRKAVWLQAESRGLDLLEWTASAPDIGLICSGGAPPDSFAVSGLTPLLGVDLRAAAAISRESDSLLLASHPVGLLDADLPGEPGPSAALALSLGTGVLASDLFQVLKQVHQKGYGRVLFMLRGPGQEPGDDAGLIISLDSESDRARPLPQRKDPPSRRSAPAYRAIRLLAEEALLAMRLELAADGSMPGDDDFTEGEATALALMAFLAAGVRAGDGTPSGEAVTAMERWLLSWPPDPRRRYPRRARTIVSTVMIEAYWRTRHPCLMGRAQEGMATILKEISTDREFRDGVEKGFEAIGISLGERCGLKGAREARDHLERLLNEAIEPETGKIVAEFSTRSSTDFIALANALTLLGNDPVADPRIQSLSGQSAAELPSTDSRLQNPQRPLSAFFHGRFAQNAGDVAFDRFVEMLKASLPKAAPARDYDIETLDPEEVRSPWSGGGRVQSVARVALMTFAYEVPDLVALSRPEKKRQHRR